MPYLHEIRKQQNHVSSFTLLDRLVLIMHSNTTVRSLMAQTKV